MAIQGVSNADVAAMARKEPKPEPKLEEKPKAEEKKEAPKNSVQERINELTREKRELEEFGEAEYEARVQAQRRIKELEAQTAPKEPEAKRPDRTQYKPEEADKYENDLLEWNRKEAIKEFQASEFQRRTQERLTELTEKARAEISDFDEVIQSADRRRDNVPPHVIAAITESDLGPQLAYYLAKNPMEAKRIFSMTPAKALLALGKVETTFSKETPKEPQHLDTAPKPIVTKAPAPMPSIQGTGDVPVDLRTAVFKDYQRKRLEEIRANPRRRR